MDEEAAAEIAPHLSAGEKLIWTGRPYPPVYMLYNGGAMGILGIFPIIGAAISLGSWLVALLIPALVLLVVAARIRGESVRYGLTDKRAIIKATWPWRSLRIIPADRFNVCVRQNFNQQIGSIMFRKTPDPLNVWRGTPFRADAFVGLSDADKVQKLIEAFSRRGEIAAISAQN
jgi:hypothetical protein